MKVDFDIPDLKDKTSIAIGTFDGVHIGHRSIIETARKYSKIHNNKFIVFTFLDHPAIVTKSRPVPHLMTLAEEKLHLFERLGIDDCIILQFTHELAQMTPQKFVEEILVKKLNVKNVCSGQNFYFGHNASGNTDTLKTLGKKHNFDVEIVQSVLFEDNLVSSTLIRNLLQKGDIETANKLLGYHYHLNGIVVRGKGIGKSLLNIPTANLQISPRKLLPKNGVYACSIQLKDKKHIGVMNIGHRPTFDDDNNKTVEIYILDFSDDIYDEILDVNIEKYIRDEQFFDSIHHLKEQIIKDIKHTANLLKLKTN